MADRSIEERIAVIEGYMAGRTLEEHFREHAELIDRRFAEVHARFTAQDKRFEAIESRFTAIEFTLHGHRCAVYGYSQPIRSH